MAKKRKAKARKKVRKVALGLGTPGLADLARRIPKGGLTDPALRRDIGSIPGLSPV